MDTQSLKSYFAGKKITVLGLGLLGRGRGDVRFLAEHGAELIVTDLKNETELEPSLRELKGFSNITYRLGGHDLADFKDRDFVLRAAGVPLDSVFIAEARKNDIPVKMSASWFAELSQIPIVGVTGTRGKTTVVYLLETIMKAAGMDVLLGGNVRGVSTLALVDSVRPNSIALMELDSWQLQGFGDVKISPSLAVFTTFFPDHLNYYKGGMDNYLDDKAQIFLNQGAEDTLVVSTQVAPILKEKYGRKIVSRVSVADPAKFPKGWTFSLPGEHNKLNAMCAIEAARVLGIDESVIREAIARFNGVPGRLEFLREVGGVKIYNDTTATTPEATIAALKALDPEGKKNILLIMGGADKGLDMSELVAEIPRHSKGVLLLAGTGTDKIKDVLRNITIYRNIADAVTSAFSMTKEGDIILFSPAFASFGMFKNEYDRGDQFVALVKNL